MKTIFNLSFLILVNLIISSISIDAQIQRPIGTNLSGVVDWSTEFVFVDVMKQSRNWISHDLGPNAEWNSNVEIPLGPNGYPLSIPYDNGVNPPQVIRTIMFADLEYIFPNGGYRVMADGDGEIQMWGAASVTLQCPIDTIVQLDNSAGILGLEILESNIEAPVHNIRVVMPGYHDSFESNPFHPELLSFLKDFQVVRYMDWMKTNGSEVQEWSDRNVPNHFTQTLSSGIAYENLIALSNLIEKDFWINIPHQASDDFITKFAQMLHDQTNPNLKIYLEYSNEVWNGIFSQNQYAAEAASALGYTGDPWDLSWQYTAKRSADVFRIFEDVFFDDSRLVKIVPGFAANAWVNNYILERFNDPVYNPTSVTADALAIAPYFGGVANTIGDAGLENTITVEAILDSMENSLPQSYFWMEENKTLADDYNLDLIAYEGGQHLVAYYPYSENEAFVNKLLDANRHPRMEDLYCQYFDYWFDTAEGGLFAHFSSHGGYSKHGAWGVKETYDDIYAPKYLGLQNCVFSYNSITNSDHEQIQLTQVELFPSLINDQLTIKGNLGSYNINIYDVSGVLHKSILIEDPYHTFSVEELPSGMYFVSVKNKTMRISEVLKIIKQ